MREIGKVPGGGIGPAFEAYLLAHRIKSKVVPSRDGWSIWVIDEDQVPRASESFRAFLDNPDNPEYRAAVPTARAIQKEIADAEKVHRKNSRDLRERWEGPAWARYPFTLALIGLSIGVGIATSFGGSKSGRAERWLIFSDYDVVVRRDALSGLPSVMARSHGLDDIRSGQVWRLITPIFLHFGLTHLLFNMMALRSFGGLIEIRKGSLRLGLLVLVTAILSNIGQYVDQSYRADFGVFGGMSGVCYALFGYLWTKGAAHPEEHLSVNRNTVVMMLAWFALCATGQVGPIANTAHGVGLASGMLLGLTRF